MSASARAPAAAPPGVMKLYNPELCAQSLRMTTRLENARGTGYLVVGALLMLGGALLMGFAGVAYPPIVDLDTHETIRQAFATDKRRDAMFGSGIALLTTGGLMFFGFGLTSVIANKMVHVHQHVHAS